MVSVVRFCARAATSAPVPYTARPAMKQTLRPQMSVSLLPGIISAAIVSVNSVMVVWIPVTEVPRSVAIVLIATFMLEPAKLQMNWASARGITMAPAVAAALTLPVRELVMSVLPGPQPGRARMDSSRSGGRAGLPIQRGVQACRGIDEGQMGERLREVADLLTGQGDLHGVETDMVGVGEHLLEGRPRVLDAAGAGQGVDVGERAEREGAFGAAQSVRRGLWVVAVHQAVGDQLPVHRLQGGDPPRVTAGDEPDRGHPQQRGVQDVGVVVLDEGLACHMEALLHDLLVDPVPLSGPALQRCGKPVLDGHPDAAVEGDPAHHPAVGERLAPAAGLPDALLRLVPVVGEPVQDAPDRRPSPVGDLEPGPIGCVDAVESLAVDVELQLLAGAFADPHGRRTPVAGPVVEGILLEVGGAVDPVHDVERTAVAALPLPDPVAQPVPEPVGLVEHA